MIQLVQQRSKVACVAVVALCLVTLANAGGVVSELDEKTWDRMLTGEWMVEL